MTRRCQLASRFTSWLTGCKRRSPGDRSDGRDRIGGSREPGPHTRHLRDNPGTAFIAINCLLNDSTRGLIGERELKRMRPTSYLISTAREPVVQEAALVRALTENWIAGAGLDVYETEPPPPDHSLFRLNNVIVTPHGLPWTEKLARDNSAEACLNILAVTRGEAPGGLVNREVAGDERFLAKLERCRNRSNP